MSWAKEPRSLELNDEEKYDLMVGSMGPAMPEPPDYPSNLQFQISKEDLATAGAEGGDVDDVMHFAAMGEVTSTFHGRDNCRIELEVTQFAGEDGKFFDLSQPVHLCLCGPELEKIALSDDAERGDMIHLIGKARLESRSNSEYGGDMASLQIIALTYEDESDESREE